jgi:hypothetical protein
MNSFVSHKVSAKSNNGIVLNGMADNSKGFSSNWDQMYYGNLPLSLESDW